MKRTTRALSPRSYQLMNASAESDACLLRLIISVCEVVFHSDCGVFRQKVLTSEICVRGKIRNMFFTGIKTFQHDCPLLMKLVETIATLLNTSISKVQVLRVVG